MQRKNLFAVSAPLRLKQKKDAPQHVLTISLFHYFTISLFNNLHLRHLITLTNLINHIQPFYHAAEASVIAVKVRSVIARVANEKL